MLTTVGAKAQEAPPAAAPQKSAPFDAIEWPADDAAKVRVLVEKSWWNLEAVDGVEVEKITAFIAKHWSRGLIQKRFAEDLVEVMTKMGHSPKATVTLRV